MYSEQFKSNKSETERYEQMSIFDLLPPEDWGDARPEDYLPKLPDWQSESEERRRDSIARIKAKIKKKKKEEEEENEIERTCVWCGITVDGPLDEHEDGCAS